MNLVLFLRNNYKKISIVLLIVFVFVLVGLGIYGFNKHESYKKLCERKCGIARIIVYSDMCFCLTKDGYVEVKID